MDRRGVDGVGDIGHCWRGVRRQVFKVSAVGLGDTQLNLPARLFIDIISRRSDIHGAGGLARSNSNGVAIAQRNHDRSLRCIGQRCGVSDLTTFGNGNRRGQGQNGGVDGVRNRSDSGRCAWCQLLEVTARCASDRSTDGAAIQINIVRRRGNIHRAGAFACGNGDNRAVGQGHGDRSLRRVGQRRSVSDLAAFGDSVVRRQ